MKFNENNWNSLKIDENHWKFTKINANQYKSIDFPPHHSTPPHREGEAPHPCGVGGPAHRHAFQALHAEISGTPEEKPEIYCWDWKTMDDAVMEALQSELMDEPYVQLKKEMEKKPEMAQKLREAAMKNLNNPEECLTISLKQLKELSSMD